MINKNFKETVWYDSKKTIQSLICKLRTLYRHLHVYRAIIRLLYSSVYNNVNKYSNNSIFCLLQVWHLVLSQLSPIILLQFRSNIIYFNISPLLAKVSLLFAKVRGFWQKLRLNSSVLFICESNAVLLQKLRFYSQISNWFPKVAFLQKFCFYSRKIHVDLQKLCVIIAINYAFISCMGFRIFSLEKTKRRRWTRKSTENEKYCINLRMTIIWFYDDISEII